MPRKVLIITYYWPPAGSIAAQRWLKFSKYLLQYDWQPIIYTVSNGTYSLIDEAKIKEIPETILVIRRPIWEPHKLYQFFSGKKKNSSSRDDIKSNQSASFVQKILIWLRGNFFIPDARAMWIRPSIKFLTEYLKTNPVDAIVSTGPPHSMHLIALALKKKLNIPWLADFRDPWTSMDYYKDLMLTSWADKKHHRLENEVLNKADAVSVVGPSMKKEFEKKRGRKVEVVTNGFDDSDFKIDKPINLDSQFTIVHLGSMYERRNPKALWNALAELKKENHLCYAQLKVKLIGTVDPSIIEITKSLGIDKKIELIKQVSHQEAIKQMKSAQVLLLPIDNFEGAQWVLTGKLFEYLAAQRPILCIGPIDGDAAQVLAEAKAGQIFDFNDVPGIKKHLELLYHLFCNKELNLTESTNQEYSHKNLTAHIVRVLNGISETV